MEYPVVHFEIVGHDGPSLRRFYADAFGWKANVVPGPADHGIVAAGEQGIGGGIGESPDRSSHVTVYVQVADLEATLAKIESLGGHTVLPPTSLHHGARIAHFVDPQGNRIGLAQPPS